MLDAPLVPPVTPRSVTALVAVVAMLLAVLVVPAVATERGLRISDPLGDVQDRGGGSLLDRAAVDVTGVDVRATTTGLRVTVTTAHELPNHVGAGLMVVLADQQVARHADRVWFLEALRGRAPVMELVEPGRARSVSEGACGTPPPLVVDGVEATVVIPSACFRAAPDVDLYVAAQAVEIRSADRTEYLYDPAPSSADVSRGTSLAGPIRPLTPVSPPVDRPVDDTCVGDDDAGFSDVPRGGVHAGAIACLVDRGLTNGVSADRFAPTTSITRGQVAAFLVRTLEEGGASVPSDPPRVCGSGTFARDADALIALGAATTAACDGQVAITRAQMAAWTSGALAAAGVSAEATVDWYGDDAGSPDRASVDRLTSLGVVTGTGQGFSPFLGLTRAQMATFLARTLDALVDHS